MDQFIGGAKFCNRILDSIVKCAKTRRNEILIKLALSDTAMKLKKKYGWNVNDQARFWNNLSVDTAKLFKPCKLPNFLYGIISKEEFSDLTNDPLADHIVNKLYEMQETENINSAPCCKIVNGHVQCNCSNNTTQYGLDQESGDTNQTYICEDGDYITNEFDDNQVSLKTAKNTPPSQSLKSLKDENFMNINITVNLDFELGEIFRVLSLRPYKPKIVNKNRSTQLLSTAVAKDGTENESITSIKQKGLVLRRNYKKDLIKDPTTLITAQCNEEVSMLTTDTSGSSLSIGDMVNLIGLIKRIVKCMVNFGVPIIPGLGQLQQRPITMNESKFQKDYIMDHSIGFWPLVFDKRSYTQTLANIFNLAHLLKEGHLQFLPFTQEVGDKIQELLEVKTRNSKFTNTATKQKKKRTSIYLDVNTNDFNDDNSLSYLHSVNALQNRMEPVMINNNKINVKREPVTIYSDNDINSISTQELTMTQAQKRSRRNKEPSITANRAVKTEFLTGENSEMPQTGILNNANNVNANKNKQQSGRLNPQFFPRIHFSQLYAVTLQKLGWSNYLDINLSGPENNVVMIKEIFNNLFKRGFDDENTINNSLTLNDTVNDNVNINNLEQSQNLFTSLTYNHLDLSHKEWQALHRFVKRYPII